MEIFFTNEITNHNITLSDDVRSLRFMRGFLCAALDPGTSHCFAAWGARSSPLANIIGKSCGQVLGLGRRGL